MEFLYKIQLNDGSRPVAIIQPASLNGNNPEADICIM